MATHNVDGEKCKYFTPLVSLSLTGYITLLIVHLRLPSDNVYLDLMMMVTAMMMMMMRMVRIMTMVMMVMVMTMIVTMTTIVNEDDDGWW